MKFIIPTLAVLLSFSAQAQTPEQMKMLQRFQNMTPEQIQAEAAKMQTEMNKLGACTQGLDMKKLEALEKRGKALAQKIETLCAAGKESEAEAYAMKEGRKLESDPMLQKMKKCAGEVKLPEFDFTPSTKENATRKSICEK